MLLDVSGIDKSAVERIFGLYDGEMAFSVAFNDATNKEHDALKAKGSGADRIACWFRGTAIGNKGAGLVSKQINYDWSRGQDGSLAGTIQLLGNGYGLEYGDQLTAGKRTDTTATNGASQDNLASSVSGWSAYLHVFAFAGTSVTVTIQESSDNGGGDPFAGITGGAFAAVAVAPATERIKSAALTTAVERYVRAVTTGTFSNAVFAVLFTRNPVTL